MIRLAVGILQSGILEARDGAYEGMKAMVPSGIQKSSPSFGAPDQVDIYREIISCHTLTNGIAGKLVEKISGESAAPLALKSIETAHPGLTAGPIHWRPFGPQMQGFCTAVFLVCGGAIAR